MPSDKQNTVTPDQEALIKAAIEARRNAAATYSHFRVGAALEDTQGRIWTGCNVESSSYGLSCCAERVALFKAISEGVRSFRKIAIVAGGPNIATPCGACRQVLHDYAPDLQVILHNPRTKATRIQALQELIPHAFGDSDLEEEE
ncbi:MAG: cytidine deaminase [bacterium]